ncbi:glycosyl hydrolase family 8 [Roseomonas sp. E05]|uniref:glycosyl hydrolase family 8 n=1 Tax=Roseomonas sp. E05 TaxID=3046310 RepID=UPI0024B88144|nr:glycosyl hydrolase family 8 [Roseomonas sp. E05]MDJ0387168.1 glycosyl hydrolase family 8 [Roseomonas sp. E05]
MLATTRRHGLVVLSAALLTGLPRPARNVEFSPQPRLGGAEEWEEFKRLYVTPEGRVVDTANQNSSHSEGQGWGLLFAEAFDDQSSFNRILSWTRRELARPYDSLHAWSWRPGRPVPVEDQNNATDGDVFIAWAAARGARRWDRPELQELSRRIVRDLHQACVRNAGGQPLLLPAAFGFEHPGYVVINPSYYVFPAFAEFANLMPSADWLGVQQTGLTLLRQARFGRWGLPADWVQLSRGGDGGRPRPAQGWPPRFSYDAVRVPLYLAWAGLAHEPAARAAAQFWGAAPPQDMPAWTELVSNSLAPYAADAGIRAIARLVQDPEAGPADLPRVREAQTYYAAALVLLARLAAFERLLQA